MILPAGIATEAYSFRSLPLFLWHRYLTRWFGDRQAWYPADRRRIVDLMTRRLFYLAQSIRPTWHLMAHRHNRGFRNINPPEPDLEHVSLDTYLDMLDLDHQRLVIRHLA